MRYHEAAVYKDLETQMHVKMKGKIYIYFSVHCVTAPVQLSKIALLP
jgi:hypothetical protein